MAVSSIIDQIMELEAQKQALMAKAKNEALSAAEKAIADLNDLGFNYRLVEGGSSTTTAATSSGTRTRRTGIADELLDLIKKSTEGLSRGAILEQLNATEKSVQQSISNALSNLKKKGQLVLDNGIYRAK